MKFEVKTVRYNYVNISVKREYYKDGCNCRFLCRTVDIYTVLFKMKGRVQV